MLRQAQHARVEGTLSLSKGHRPANFWPNRASAFLKQSNGALTNPPPIFG
jgi:hypothetical protein